MEVYILLKNALSVCPHERIRAYKKIVKDLMTTKYLSEHVRR
jgi:hypothetical protein